MATRSCRPPLSSPTSLPPPPVPPRRHHIRQAGIYSLGWQPHELLGQDPHVHGLHHLQVPIVQQSDYHVVVRQHLSNPGPVPIPLILLYILADGSPRSLYLPFANFDSFNSTCVLPNIWAEQSLSTSLMSYGDGSKHSDHYFCRCQSNTVTTILLFLEKNERKKRKVLRIA